MYLDWDRRSDRTRALMISINCPLDIRQCAPRNRMAIHIAMHVVRATLAMTISRLELDP